MAFHKGLAVAATAAALSVFADFGLSCAALQPVRRGDLDLSSPYIPPAKQNPTREQIAAVKIRMAKAEAKRARKAARNMALVAAGGLFTA